MAQSNGNLSRRRFLQLAGAGAVAAGTAGWTTVYASPRSSKATLKVAYFGSQQAANAEAKIVVGPFQAKHPGVTVQYEGIPATDWNGFFEKVLSNIAAGNPPDVTTVATEGLQLTAAKKIALPLDHYVKRDKSELKPYFADVHPALVEAMMYKGHLYCLPENWNAADMFYNTSLLSQIGMSRPPADWTKADFTDMVSHYKNNKKVSGWDFIVRLWGSWTPWMYANNGNLYKESRYPGGEWMWEEFYKDDPAAKGRKGGFKWGDPTATSAPVEEALDFMVELYHKGIAPTPDVGGGTLTQGLFASNHILTTPSGEFWALGLHQSGMKPTGYDIQFWPKWKSQRHLFGTAGYIVAQSTSNKELAWEWTKNYVSKQVMSALFTAGTPPARRSLFTANVFAPTGPLHWQVFYDTLDKFPNTMPIPASPTYDAMANAFNQRTTQAFSSGGSAKQALQALQQDMEQIQQTESE